jgi:predicted amino acid-binding ACT domain protein
VRGIAHDVNVGKIAVVGVPDRPGLAASVFQPLAKAGISVDVIVQNVTVEGATDLSFTVARGDLNKAMRIIEPVAREIGAKEVRSSDLQGKVSVVGAGIQSAPGIAAATFQALFEAGINIEMITTSEIRITCIVDRDKVQEAVQKLIAARLAADVLTALGGDLEVVRVRGVVHLRGFGCPLSATVAGQPSICSAVETLVSELTGEPVRECCQHGERPQCGFAIG